MFERFTERARQVPVYAQDEARLLRHDHIGTEHLLLGLLREEEGVAARVLDDLGVGVEDVRERVVAIVQVGDEPSAGQIPFTPRAKKVLELSLREALSMGHNHIGTEHILLGLAHEGDGVGARVLSDLGIDAETVRQNVVAIVGEGGPPGPGWTGYAPIRRRRFHRRRTKWMALSEARDAALEDGDYELARKLLELEIEARQKGSEPPPPE